MTDPRKRIQELTDSIKVHDKAYHDDGAPLISDAQYDAMVAELTRLEREHPECASPTSPTKEVGGSPGQVEHRAYMGSVNKAGDMDKMDEFFKRVGGRCVATPKLDGVAFSLVYENGKLVRALTRGDGKRGWDHTANMEHIPSVPNELPCGAPTDLEIRGEMMISHTNFDLMSGRHPNSGRVKPAKRRNCVAGIAINHKATPKALSHLSFHAYWALNAEGLAQWPTADETYEKLTQITSVVEPHRFVDGVDDLREYLDNIERDGDLGTEGVVVRLNDCAAHHALGWYGKGAVGTIAYKW